MPEYLTLSSKNKPKKISIISLVVPGIIIFLSLAVFQVKAQGESKEITWDDVFNFLKTKQSQNGQPVNLIINPAAPSPSPTPESSSDSRHTLVNISPLTPVINSSLSIGVEYNPVQPLNDVAVDIEIYNSSDQKVYQQYFEHQNIFEKSIYQVNWTPEVSGTYRVKMGIFSNNWTNNLFWFDNIKEFTVTNTISAITPYPANNNPQNPGGAPNQQLVSAYSVGGDGRIYKNGQKLTLKGVSWFGMESDVKSPHGLWSRNWQEMISQIKNAGFNAVRLPYCPQTLQNVTVGGIDASLNPDLKNLRSLEIMDKVVAEFNRQQIFILLDQHTQNCQSISDLWTVDGYTESQWINDLKFLADRYRNTEYFIGLDIKNEPKGIATWGTGNVSTDWNKAAERAGKNIIQTNPNILVFIEGIESNPTCSDNSIGHWWGGNFEPINCVPLDNNVLPANKIVFSPHVYGPDVYPQPYFSTTNFPSNMTAIWEKHFGFLKNQGFAVAIGEWGGKYGQADPKDVTWQNSLSAYLVNKGICDSFYWSWNPNSGDTGGILNDDWSTVRSDKLQMLNNYWQQCK